MCANDGPFTKTCKVLRDQNKYASAIPGAAKFYVLTPGSVLKPHCGQANLRLFLQLGVIVPSGVSLTVGGIEQRWSEGKVLILDDSFLHSVVHRGTKPRV